MPSSRSGVVHFGQKLRHHILLLLGFSVSDGATVETIFHFKNESKIYDAMSSFATQRRRCSRIEKILFLLTKMVETCSVAFLIQMISYGGPKLLAHRQVIVLLSEWQQLDLPSRIEGLSMKGPN